MDGGHEVSVVEEAVDDGRRFALETAGPSGHEQQRGPQGARSLGQERDEGRYGVGAKRGVTGE